MAHRDLKPENLLLTEDFNLVITDFGLSAVLDDGSEEWLSTYCGTRGYMAPEIIARQTVYLGPSADVWSAAVVLFVMLAGFPPFEAAQAPDWWFKRVAAKVRAE